MKRWTMKELAQTDDITFAMSVLSEKLAGLATYTPMAQKLAQARNTLDTLRGGQPITPGKELEKITRRKLIGWSVMATVMDDELR